MRLIALAASVGALATALAPAAVAVVPAHAGSLRPFDSPHTQRATDRSAASAAFVPGEAVVRFEPGTTAAERRAARLGADVALERTLAVPRAQLVEVDGAVAAAVARLRQQPDVAFAQPNYVYRALGTPPPDPRFGQLWGLHNTGQTVFGSVGIAGIDVNALEAWDHSRGTNQVIAVADTGVDVTHPDLVANLWTNPDEPKNGLDDDGNGIVDDVHGADLIDGDGNPDDLERHGSHVAGTVAAATNGIGVAGVAPDARIMGVRVLDAEGFGTSAGIANGTEYAADQGADVLNLSLGGPPDAGDALMAAAIRAATETVVVAAAGNDGSDNDAEPTTPCTFHHLADADPTFVEPPNLICVAAVDNRGALADFSNFGSESVDVAAPGVDTLSTRTDYDAAYAESFEGDITAGWVLEPGWHRTNATAYRGSFSLADSAGDYGANEDKLAYPQTGGDLTGRTGCRMQLELRLATADAGDGILISAQAPGETAGTGFTGNTGGSFESIDFPIASLDDEPNVIPVVQFISDSSGVADGAYVDDLALACRGATYDATNYVYFSGTSMATPHVAGAAALVTAAAPAASPSQVVEALRAGVQPLVSLQGKTVTGGLVDACRAVHAALNRAPDCARPGSQTPTDGSPATGTSGAGGTGTVETSQPTPSKAVLPGRAIADRRGRLALRVSGDPGTTGALRLTARLPRAALLRTVARKAFAIGLSGRATVRVRLSRAARRVLVRNGRLRVRARAVLRNAASLTSSATRVVRIRLRR